MRKFLELKKAMWERRQGRITAILGQLWLRLKDFSSPFFAQCPLLDLLARRHHIGACDDDGDIGGEGEVDDDHKYSNVDATDNDGES